MEKELLNKKNTTILHGIAILMMIYHHLFINGNTWYVDKSTSLLNYLNVINISDAPTFQLTFAWFCKICVAIFAFTSGYAMFKQFDKKCDYKIDIFVMYKYCLKRFFNFYKKFFLCFVFFVGCEYFMGNKDGFDFSLLNFILNLIGVRASYNGTWWYILVYYYMILISPIVYIILKKIKLKHYLIVAGVFVLSIVVSLFTGHLIDYLKLISVTVQNYVMIYLLIFIEGMFFANYKLIDIIASKLNAVTSVLLFVVVFVLRALVIRAPSDSLFDIVFISPFIISVTKIVNYLPHFSKGLEFIGKYSSYMWYCHAYFYSYLFFDLVLHCNMSLIVYVQVVLYSLLSSIIFTFIEKKLDDLFFDLKYRLL